MGHPPAQTLCLTHKQTGFNADMSPGKLGLMRPERADSVGNKPLVQI